MSWNEYEWENTNFYCHRKDVIVHKMSAWFNIGKWVN